MSVYFFAGYDAARSGNMTIGIVESGGATGTATLSAEYMPDVDLSTVAQMDDQGVATTYALGYESMETAAATALNAIATSAITASLDRATRKWTFTSDGAGGVTAIALTFNAAAQRYFGFAANVSGALTHAGTKTAFYVMEGALGGVTELQPPHEVGDDLAVDLIASDGTVEGLAQDAAVQVFTLTLPHEPAAKVWHESAAAADPYTWQLMFRHLRNIEPFLIVDTDSGAGFSWVGKLRADTCHFEPTLLGSEYFAEAHIVIAAHFLGTT